MLHRDIKISSWKIALLMRLFDMSKREENVVARAESTSSLSISSNLLAAFLGFLKRDLKY
jgi:hypothetical protein